MRTIERYNNLRVPSWALCYLVNGDASGLEESDIKAVDKWYQQFIDQADEIKGGHVIFSPGDNEEYFTRSPEFGLDCSCIDSTVLIVAPEKQTAAERVTWAPHGH